MKGQLLGTSGDVLKSLYQMTKQLIAAVVMNNEYDTSKVRSKGILLMTDSHQLNMFAHHVKLKIWSIKGLQMELGSMGF